jgi:hypothetical protein
MMKRASGGEHASSPGIFASLPQLFAASLAELQRDRDLLQP